ncbi:MAG TPA: ROK family transcriptional regulator [Thermoleophilaceae bacterium]
MREGVTRVRRSASRDEVVRALRRHGALSRPALSVHTGLSRATVAGVIGELIDDGTVVELTAEPDGRAGRPAAVVRLGRQAGAVVGVDIDRQHVRVAVADLGHQILAERVAPADAEARDPEHGLATAELLIDEVLADADVGRAEVQAVGVGIPGPVTATGELGSSTILPGWSGVRAEQRIGERLGLPVLVDNDANLGALGEWTAGAARSRANCAYIKASAGVGCGLILGGAPFRGAGGTAGELGHTIVDPSGAICRCGNRGCLETIVGTGALLALLEPAYGPLTLAEAIDRALAGDPACGRAIADAGAAIGAAAANLCNLINPELVVVGGDLAPAGELLLRPLREALRGAAIKSAGVDAEVVGGTLGDRAELLGAVALALHALPADR